MYGKMFCSCLRWWCIAANCQRAGSVHAAAVAVEAGVVPVPVAAAVAVTTGAAGFMQLSSNMHSLCVAPAAW